MTLGWRRVVHWPLISLWNTKPEQAVQEPQLNAIKLIVYAVIAFSGAIPPSRLPPSPAILPPLDFRF